LGHAGRAFRGCHLLLHGTRPVRDYPHGCDPKEDANGRRESEGFHPFDLVHFFEGIIKAATHPIPANIPLTMGITMVTGTYF
jgi:hypothetical protein